MGTLREEARYYREDFRGGTSWILFWKVKRSWHLYLLWNTDYDERTATWEMSYEDADLVHKVMKVDPNALVLNGYYSNLGDPDSMTTDSLTNALLRQYEDGGNAQHVLTHTHIYIKEA